MTPQILAEFGLSAGSGIQCRAKSHEGHLGCGDQRHGLATAKKNLSSVGWSIIETPRSFKDRLNRDEHDRHS